MEITLSDLLTMEPRLSVGQEAAPEPDAPPRFRADKIQAWHRDVGQRAPEQVAGVTELVQSRRAGLAGAEVLSRFGGCRGLVAEPAG